MDSGTRVKLLICLVSDFGSFDYLCSFDSRTLPQRRPSMTDTLMIPAPSASKCLHPQSLSGPGNINALCLNVYFPGHFSVWRH